MVAQLKSINWEDIMVTQLILASDYRGIALREELSNYAIKQKWNFKDIGIPEGSPLDYVDISRQLAEEMKAPNTIGILICGSGEGVAMATNRYCHVRAAVCRSAEDAESVRKRLNANVICLGSRHVNLSQSLKIIDTFLSTPFGVEKHGPYAAKLDTSPTNHSFQGVNLIVRAAILHKNHILLTRATSGNREFDSNLYFLPGGHVDHNEGALTALHREIKEEMGVGVNDAKFIGALECSWPRKGLIYHELNLIYHTEIGGLSLENPPVSMEKQQEFVWQPLDALKSLRILPSQLIPLLHQRFCESSHEEYFYSQMQHGN